MGEFVSEATRPGLNTQRNRVGQFHELWYSHETSWKTILTTLRRNVVLLIVN